MSRSPRICVDGAVYHITCRGNNRQSIFMDDVDYQQYLLLLRRHQEKLKFKVLCYCLMPNHVHLVLEPAEHASISRIMGNLSTHYSQDFNKRHGRVGHVFQGRFYSRPIQEDGDLLAVSRYVHLNPVKARLCQKPGEYPWSSYQAYVSNPINPLKLVDSDLVLGLISSPEQARRGAYQTLVESPLDSESGWEPEPLLRRSKGDSHRSRGRVTVPLPSGGARSDD